MPSDCMAIVNSYKDCSRVSKYYNDVAGVRLPLDKAREFLPELIPNTELWIDAGVDGLHREVHPRGMSDSYEPYVKRFRNGAQLLEHGLAGECSQLQVNEFVGDVLTKCSALSPKWITVPQVPYDTAKGTGRTKLNKQLAHATGKWRASHLPNSRLMFPVILCQRDALNKKMKWRNDVVKYLLSSLEKCGADGVWVVNSDLQDEQGSHPNEEERFPGLIEFHKELRAKLADGIRILAGPYWAMNLVLWARGLIQNPVIAIATGYQHHISGGRVKAPSDRLVIPPLRRRVTTPNLGTWLQNAHRMLLGTAAPASKIGGIGSSFAQAAQELAPLSRQLNRLKGDLAHVQVARFYRDWIAGLEKTPPRMRALALHQDLSSAHVVGSILGDLPKGNKPRQAGKLAKQYMLSCL